MDDTKQAPEPLGPRFREALEYTARLHETQSRKGGSIPYLAHLLAVTALEQQIEGREGHARG